MDRKNEAINCLKQYTKMRKWMNTCSCCGPNKHKVSGADEREMNRT